MTSYTLEQFIADAQEVAQSGAPAAACVDAVAPLMRRLLTGDRAFLSQHHFRDDPDHYARNGVHISKDGGVSLYTLVWNPGQWTPVHDHGTWGVVGVIRGVLEERNEIRTDPGGDTDQGIVLRRGGVTLLAENAVTSFVPNPDHIHKTGVREDQAQAVSLHLYGREMNSFHIYDVEAGTRKMIEVFHNES